MLLPAVCLAQPPPAPKDGPSNGKRERRGMDRPLGEGLKAADFNYDGLISKEELAAMPRIANLPEEKREKLFKRLDKNGDGSLGRDELGHMGKPREGEGQQMPRLWELDTDESGGVGAAGRCCRRAEEGAAAEGPCRWGCCCCSGLKRASP